jgi:hypothetical protein
VGENGSAAGRGAARNTTNTDPAGASGVEASATTEAAPTTGANLISLAQTAVGQIAPVIQAVTGTSGARNNAAAS